MDNLYSHNKLATIVEIHASLIGKFMEVYIDDVMVKSQDFGIKYGSSFSKYILIFFAPFCFLILTHAQLANDWVSLTWVSR